MKKILIRADGSKDIGMGHLSRCCLIANYFFDDKNIESVIIAYRNNAAENFLTLKNKAAKIHYLDIGSSIENEVEIISSLVKSEGVGVILLDLLEVNLTKSYLGLLKENLIPIAAITDDSDYREIDVDVILNGNPNQDRFDYAGLKGKYLVGPAFFIMDREYADIKLTPNVFNKNIMLTFGGSDHNNLIFGVLEVVLDIPEVDNILIISSKSTGYIKQLEAFTSEQSKNIMIIQDVESLVPYWDDCYLAITAGGNTLFERIASGVPGATICQLSRQMEIADKFEKNGLNKNLGFGPELKKDEMKALINSFMNDEQEHNRQREKSKEIDFGNGINLFANELCKLIGDKNEL